MAFPRKASRATETFEPETVLATPAAVTDEPLSAEEIDRGHAPRLDPHALPPALRTVVTMLTFALIVALPLWFGGVHPSTYLSLRILTCAALLAFFFWGQRRLHATFGPGTISRLILVGCFAVLGAVALQSLFFLAIPFIHPVLGPLSLLQPTPGLRSFVWGVLTFGVTFAFIRAWIGPRESKAEKLLTFLFLAGTLVSLTALSHWFYDTGKLFWTFEPEHVFTSTRARWPFVNSNHLAHFLLPIFFLMAAAFSVTLLELRDLALTTQKSNKRSWGLLLSSSRVQHRLIRLGFLAALGLATALCIAASLSRGSWFGMSIGLLIFAFRQPIFGRDPKPQLGRPEGSSFSEDAGFDAVAPAGSALDRRKRHRSKHSHISREQIVETFARLSSLAKPLLGVSAALLVYFFLYGRGSELFIDRLEYGLMYSQDDMRWQLYRDTLPMIREHLFLGVGAGGWASQHPRYMAVALSGVNPVYLHSDPLQFVAELGIVAGSFLAAALLMLVWNAVKLARSAKGRDRAALTGLVCGGISLAIASCLDFPFRIPAISTLAAALLALTAFYMDRAKVEAQSSKSAPPGDKQL